MFVHKKPHPNLIDRTGQRQGMLTVLRRDGSATSGARWLCRCDCGVEKPIAASGLAAGVQSCGCIRGRPNCQSSGWRSTRWADVNASPRNRVLKTYKAGAKSRGLSWEISNDFFYAVTQKSCFYCGVPPSRATRTVRGGEFIYNGLDRPDNALGYVESNVVPCCSQCNMAKGTMNRDQFVEWLDRLVAFRVASK